MVRTKYLKVSQGLDNFEEIDELINDFIKCHPEIEIIDIKFQSNVSAVADNYVSAEYYHTSALIIYKENQR